jgi:cell division protein FtsA
VRSFNSRGVVAVSGKDREIARDDIARVVDAARGVQIPQDHEVVHVVPREFAVDGQDGVADPVGMVGARLEADVHVVTAPVAVTQNIVTCMNKAGIEVVQLVLEQFAAAEAVLSSDERELGICLIDIGGGTTEVAVYQKGSIAHTAVIPIGGDHFTNDLAVVLRAPITDAERIKKKFGSALRSAVGEEEMVEVPMVGGRAPKLCPRTTLADILQPRAEELLGLIKEDLERLGLDKELRSGVVLTGGGAELEGLVEVAEGIFQGPVRRGIPAGVGGLVDVVSRPEWATATGLLLYGHRYKPVRRAGRGLSRLTSSVSRMFRDFF